MRCEACGGDGLIEVGAYRGNESDTATRECRLCRGVVTEDVSLEKLGHAAALAGASLLQAASILQVAENLPRLLGSTSGSRQLVAPVPVPDTPMTQNAHGFYESKEPVPLGLPVRPKCNGSHDWLLVKYVNAGRVEKCRACDKMKYRKR